MKGRAITAEIFINECSLQAQFQTTNEFELAILGISSLIEVIKTKNNLELEFYRGNIFIGFEAIKNQTFQKTFNQLNKDTQLKFKRLLTDNLKNWQNDNERIHQSTDNYILVETSQSVTNTSVAEITERKLQKSEIAFLLVNFSCSEFTNTHPNFSLCQLITVIKNQTEPSVNLDCLDNKAAFEQWVQDKLDFRNFLERNTNRFNKTSKDVQGQSVYSEIETGNSWYLDNLHKNHFEVFNKQGEHLGEADLEGNLNKKKADKNKLFHN